MVQSYCKTCHKCQLSKKAQKKYGFLPAKQAETNPWDRVNVDLIGPYTILVNGKECHLRAMTMIDPATGWFKIGSLKHPNSDTTQRLFDSLWLCRYPRPREVGFDNGSEFKHLYGQMCRNFGLREKPMTDYNPQANAILERIHQVIGNMIRSFEIEERDLPEEDPFEPILSAVAYAIRSTYHTTLQATPGQLVFGRDMLLPVKVQG